MKKISLIALGFALALSVGASAAYASAIYYSKDVTSVYELSNALFDQNHLQLARVDDNGNSCYMAWAQLQNIPNFISISCVKTATSTPFTTVSK